MKTGSSNRPDQTNRAVKTFFQRRDFSIDLLFEFPMNEMLEFWRISKEKCFCIRAEGAERVIDWLLVVSLLDSNGRCNEVTLVFFFGD